MQDLTERVREYMGYYDEAGEPRAFGSIWPTLLTGLLGLLFGLFIGWVLWPVEWENIRPSHLDPDSKSQYIAAVADAYVAGNESQEARDLAVRRMNGMNLLQDMGLAFRYYIGDLVDDGYAQSAQFDRDVRLQNLNRLAFALNIDPELAINTVDLSGVDLREPGAIDNNGIAIDGNQSTDGLSVTGEDVIAAEGSGFNFAQALRLGLTCLFAIALILGGLYLLNFWWKRRALNDEFDDPDASGNIGPYRDKPRAGGQPEDEYDDDDYADDDGEFEEYIEGHDPYRVHEPDDAWQSTVDEVNPYRQPDIQSAPQAQSNFNAESDRGGNGGGNSGGNSGGYNGGPQANLSSSLAAGAGAVGAVGAAMTAGPAAFQRDSTVDAPQQMQQPRSRQESSPLPTQTVSGSRPQAARSASTAPSTSGVGTVITQFTARYQRGAQQYEQQRTIVAPNETGRDAPEGLNIGEYGMGVNIKNGILQSDAENVIALDVWLFDKTDQQGPRNQTRVLISEYVIDHELSSAITRDDVSGVEPIVPQKGETFEIFGTSLRLQCNVIEAIYVKSGDMMGVFESITVDMKVFHN